MFRPAVFDVTERLRPGAANTLAIRFDPPLSRIAGIPLSTWGRNVERTAMRKAQFVCGWDWGPRLPTIGIWRPVELRRERRAALAGVHGATVEITPAHNRAVVAVRVEAERFAGSRLPPDRCVDARDSERRLAVGSVAARRRTGRSREEWTDERDGDGGCGPSLG